MALGLRQARMKRDLMTFQSGDDVGLFGGSITYRRFRVLGDPPEGYRQAYLDAIVVNAHKEIEPESDDERAVGWVCVGDLLDLDFALEKIYFGDVLALTLRVDTLRIPSSVLSIYLKRAEKEYMTSLGRERLTKADREEVADRVTKALRKRALPSIKGFDMAWDIQAGVVRLWTHNKATVDDFMALFQDTFGLRLMPRTPFTALSDIGMDEEQLERATALLPADFASEPLDGPVEELSAEDVI
jgi:hypothetical protein